ncbi:MAG: winged helix-turn-helix domain-containing protein [Cyanobacteria bacterium P01_F01_bin.53]
MALNASHPRSRERLMALYEIGTGKSATAVKDSGRNPQTVMGWVHRYNQGWCRCNAIPSYGRPPPFFCRHRSRSRYNDSRESQASLDTPQERTQSLLPRWTLKRMVAWVKTTFNIDCSRESLRKILKRLWFSWKKARKLLNNANPSKRDAFLETLEGLLNEALQQQSLLVYMDEAHLHLDTDEGYGWYIRGG